MPSAYTSCNSAVNDAHNEIKAHVSGANYLSRSALIAQQMPSFTCFRRARPESNGCETATDRAELNRILYRMAPSEPLLSLVGSHTSQAFFANGITVKTSEMVRIAEGYAPHQLREFIHLRNLIRNEQYHSISQVPLEILAVCCSLRESTTMELLESSGVSAPYVCGFEADVRRKLVADLQSKSVFLNGEKMIKMLVANASRVVNLGSILENMRVSNELANILRRGFDVSFFDGVRPAEKLIQSRVYEASDKISELFKARHGLIRDRQGSEFYLDRLERGYLDTYYMDPRLLAEQYPRLAGWVRSSECPEFNLRTIQNVTLGLILDRLAPSTALELNNMREALSLARMEAWDSIYMRRGVRVAMVAGSVTARAAQVALGVRFW